MNETIEDLYDLCHFYDTSGQGPEITYIDCCVPWEVDSYGSYGPDYIQANHPWTSFYSARVTQHLADACLLTFGQVMDITQERVPYAEHSDGVEIQDNSQGDAFRGETYVYGQVP